MGSAPMEDELLITNGSCSSPLRGLGPSGQPLYGHAACFRKRRALRRPSGTLNVIRNRDTGVQLGNMSPESVA